MPVLSMKSSEILLVEEPSQGRAFPQKHSSMGGDPWEPSWFQTCKWCLCLCDSTRCKACLGSGRRMAPGKATWSMTWSCIAGVLPQPCCKRAHGNRKYLHQNSTHLDGPSCGALQREGNPILEQARYRSGHGNYPFFIQSYERSEYHPETSDIFFF